jgi:hypothetical protein
MNAFDNLCRDVAMMKQGVFVVGMFLLLASGAQSQDELQALKNQVKALEESISQMKYQIEQMESRQRLNERHMDDKLKAVEEKASSGTGGTSWVDRIKLSGDFRYRLDLSNDDDPDNTAKGSRFRNRVRARLKMQAHVNDDFDAIFRLATGSDSSPTSANQTMEGRLSEKDVWLDQMYLVYSPEDLAGFSVLAGRIANPFIRVGGNQMIWDGDIGLDGGALTYATSLSDQTSVEFTGGGIWLEEEWSDSNSDQYLLALQGAVSHQIDESNRLTTGITYYDFVNVQNQLGYSAGNSTDGTAPNDTLHNDFNLFQLFTEWGTEIQEMPFSVYGSYVKNTATETGFDEDTAWLLGVKLNKASDPGTWQLGYDYREVEKDAVLGYFTDSDFLGSTTGLTTGGTGSSGHKIAHKYQAMKNMRIDVTYFVVKQKMGSADYDLDTLFLDFVLKF